MWFVALVLVAGCRKDPGQPTPTGPLDPYDVVVGPYDATVRTTAYGIPHILAEDYGSLSFGMGYAFARDHLCTFVDQIVKVRSERALFHGPGEGNTNIDQDFGWLGLQVMAKAEGSFLGLPDDIREGLVGYAAGLNQYMETTEVIDARCQGAAWLRPVTHIDLLAYYLHLGQFGSGYNFVAEIGNVGPPGGLSRSAFASPPPPLSVLEPFKELPFGSNGWAIGSDKSENGRGMLLSNTHFPGHGEHQWWESHLTIPGKVDVYGVSLLGSALVNMGFNRDIAWTHTVSNTPRFVVYQLDLDPQNPTRYRYDGDWVDMTGTEHTIEVLQPDGSTSPMQRTLYATQWGPVFNAPLVGWSTQHAYTWRDINADNYGLLPTFFGMDHATDLASFEASHRDNQGIPWVHTMATDKDGSALYLDSAATPNLSPEAEAAYAAYSEQNVVSKLFAGFGVYVVDGNDPLYTWVNDDRAAVPGAIPYDEVPRLLRTDYVNNSNQNYWLANPAEPLTGYPMLYGPTGVPVSPRTKMNNRFLLERNGASGQDGKFSLDELEAAVLSARASLEADLRAQVVERCLGVGEVTFVLGSVFQTVDVTDACAALAAWDGRALVDSRGAHVWREFLGAESLEYADLLDKGLLFGDAFDPNDPIYTPNTLVQANPESDPVIDALATAVYRLGEAGIAPDAKLGDVQFRMRGGQAVPTLGGQYYEGLIAISSYDARNTTSFPLDAPGDIVSLATGLTESGYLVNSGNSWVMALSYTDAGPVGRAVMVYSQSEDAASPNHDDQTALYAAGQMRPILFNEADILADPELEVLELTLP